MIVGGLSCIGVAFIPSTTAYPGNVLTKIKRKRFGNEVAITSYAVKNKNSFRFKHSQNKKPMHLRQS